MKQLELFSKPIFSSNKKIRLIENFSGIGCQALALKYLGLDFEHYRSIEFDKFPVASYNAIHGTDFKPMDICKTHAEDWNIIDKDNYCYIMTYSFPCFTGDTLVLTKDGYKEIKDVKIGDYVLTHDNTYQKVLASKKTQKNADLLKISAMGIDEIKCTPNHKFLVRNVNTKNVKQNGVRHNIRTLSDAEWKEAKDIKKKDYIGIAINKESILPKWDGYTYKHGFWKNAKKINEIGDLLNNINFWWFVGRWLGDGWIVKDLTVEISVKTSQLKDVTSIIDSLGFKYSIYEKERSAQKIAISKKELVLFLSQFGKGAFNKRLPAFVFDMPCELLEALINGYESADGYIDSRGRHHASSVSKKLIYGFVQIIAKVYHRPYSVTKTYRDLDFIIDGRKAHSGDIYNYIWDPTQKKQEHSFYQDDCLWQPVNYVELITEKEDVYDITVEYNHSFTANGVIVHNCTDLSLAGQRKGMSKEDWLNGTSTRSGLIWEIERILLECKELSDKDSKFGMPDILIMENVTQVHSPKQLEDWNNWIFTLSQLGYSNHYQDLNAKNFGVAQNRDRTFMVSIKGDYDFEFPKEIPLTHVMADYLDEKVDEKYYINNERAEQLIENLKERGILE